MTNSKGKPDYFMWINRNQLCGTEWSDKYDLWLYDSGKYTNLNFCFPVKPFLLWYGLQVDKACLCKQRWNVSLFLSTWSCQIWLLQLALPWACWFIATGLQLVILIVVLTCSLFTNCLCFCLCATLGLC